MNSAFRSPPPSGCRHRVADKGSQSPGSFRPRSRLVAVVAGLLAIVWIVLRSGTKPSRMAYPCQQSAMGLAVAAFGMPGVGAILAFRARILEALGTFPGKLVLCSALVLTAFAVATELPNLLGTAGSVIEEGADGTAFLTPRADYHPEVYLVNAARGVEPGRYGGVDDLITLMGVRGLKLHRSATVGLSSGPEGLIDRDDVVLLKVNAQWSERGGTNTDVLRGAIRKIVEHPDGFIGEIVVADNGQGSGKLDRTANNAEDQGQSAQDVVNEFAGEGWSISTFLWDTIRGTSVTEYSTGNMTSGFVVAPTPDPETGIRVSYAKFRSTLGTYISYNHGIWLPGSAVYDPDKLVVINIPVLKTHSIYAVTSAVKNHMGVVTQSLSTNSHNSVGQGGMGTIMAQIRPPDLTILDCIWILARPGSGPSAPYSLASRRDQLLASRDPVALDAWAVKFILIPQIVANGYAYSSYGSTQNPDNPNSVFRNYLDRSMNEMLAAGIDVSNDYAAVDVRRWAADADRDGDLDLTDYGSFQACLLGPDVVADPVCVTDDFDADGAISMLDFLAFQSTFTGSWD